MRRSLLIFLALAAGCADPEPTSSPLVAEPGLAEHQGPLTLHEVAMDSCDTPAELVDGLSAQLVDAINCLRPGTLSSIPLGPDIGLLREGRPAYVDARGLDDLLAAADDGDRQMIIRWSYRDVALQHLFWLQDVERNCAVAAPAGLSNHQNGLAIDLNDRGYWEPIMARHGWENRLPNDRVHFDYQRADDVGLGALSLLAFQALWNTNFPDTPIPTSSELDGETYDALSMAPIQGFDLGLCEGGPSPVGPGPVRGPTVAQSAWRGCEIPGPLQGGLAEQVIAAMLCQQPGSLVALRYCAGAGCLTPDANAPPPLEWLGADAHQGLLDASRALDRPLEVGTAFIDVATQRFLSSAASNIGCPSTEGTARSPHNTGLAVRIPGPFDRDEVVDAGFMQSGALLTYIGGDDLTALGVLAFQRLWNLNREDDPIGEDGQIGPQTRGAIDRAPIAGFPEGLCDAPEPEPQPEPDVQPEPSPQPEPDAQPEPDPRPEPDAPEPDSPEPESPEPESPEPESPEPEADGGAPDEGPDDFRIRAPAPGWSALADDDEGCTQAPGRTPSSGWVWLSVMLITLRLRRANRAAR
ncbi:MAG: hypothetical protein ACI9U2_001134 [Bradymonadia bacterium]|jgi:hypothetical protein